jgi:hypothetical protein
LSGKALNQDVTLMWNLKSKELHVSNDNKRFCRGNAEIYATTLVDAKVRAGGSIYIYGSPKQIKETLFGGTIIEKNNNMYL